MTKIDLRLVFALATNTVKAPFHQLRTKTSSSGGNLVEYNYLFSIEPSSEFILFVNYETTATSRCQYYNAIVTVNTVKRLQWETECLSREESKDVLSLLNDLPVKVSADNTLIDNFVSI
jgi:hypothetical protein